MIEVQLNPRTGGGGGAGGGGGGELIAESAGAGAGAVVLDMLSLLPGSTATLLCLLRGVVKHLRHISQFLKPERGYQA